MPNNIVQFSNPIKVTLHTKEEDNEVIVVGYMNYCYEIILIDEFNNTLEIDELIKPHQRFIIDGIKDGEL
jgi:hypothetical protein